MRASDLLRSGWLLLFLIIGPVALADPPDLATDSAPAPDDPTTWLDRGLALERSRNWSPAIQVYREASEKFPSRTEFHHRQRLCEMHLRLARRYADQSFRNVLLRLSREKAFELLDEVYERIDSHFVDSMATEPLVRRGYDNLEVALRDPGFAFLRLNARNTTPDRVAWTRAQLRDRRDRLSATSRDGAAQEVANACEIARVGLGIESAPIVMEFVFGACDALPDDYTAYLTPDKLDDMFAMIDGNFVGLGVELKLDEAGLKLVGVIRGGPAAEAGLKVGDRIVSIGGEKLKGLGLDEAAGRLQGAEGTSVDVRVVRTDASTRDFRLVRRPVVVESITQAKIVEPSSGVGYIQLAGFQKTSAQELDLAIAKLRRQGMKYLVLDLRGNPGGLLNVAVEIADRFVDSGVIVSTRGRAPGQTQVYLARPDKPYTMEMAILVDRDSASASEILAGALQELKRAVVIGDRSYGKGSVQSIFELKSAPAGLKLTTAKFYSPRNRAYSEQGVTPDIPVIVVAKPVEGRNEITAAEFGDPSNDLALGTAVRTAKRQLTANR